MIVCDEERLLGRALASVRSVADQIVVVDTGSRDGTALIAARAGALVVHEPWRDDFSAARNASLEAATCDWIFPLDADEVLEPASERGLVQALHAAAYAQLSRVHHLKSSLLAGASPSETVHVVDSIRPFRRHPGIRYRGRVHEGVAEALLDLGHPDWPDSGVRVLHDGYAEHGERQRKNQRNVRLLELAYGDDRDNLFVGFKLAQSSPAGPGRREMLLRHAEQALALEREQLRSYPFLPRLIALACQDLVATGELTKAGALAARAAARIERSTWFTAGSALLRAGVLTEARGALDRYLGDPVSAMTTSGVDQPDPGASARRALHLLGRTALLELDYDRAWTHLARAAQSDPSDPSDAEVSCAARCDLVRVWLGRGRIPDAAAELSALTAAIPGAPSRPVRRELMLVSAELSIANGDRAGALPLARAALQLSGDLTRDGDDRGAALLALVLLGLGPDRLDEAVLLLPALPGCQFDTLAVRLLLTELRGDRTAHDAPEATHRALQALKRQLPAAVRARLA